MTMMMLGHFDDACANFRHIVQTDPNSEAAKNAQRQLAYCP
jgi:hypothetical protein